MKSKDVIVFICTHVDMCHCNLFFYHIIFETLSYNFFILKYTTQNSEISSPFLRLNVNEQLETHWQNSKLHFPSANLDKSLMEWSLSFLR